MGEVRITMYSEKKNRVHISWFKRPGNGFYREVVRFAGLSTKEMRKNEKGFF